MVAIIPEMLPRHPAAATAIVELLNVPETENVCLLLYESSVPPHLHFLCNSLHSISVCFLVSVNNLFSGNFFDNES